MYLHFWRMLAILSTGIRPDLFCSIYRTINLVKNIYQGDLLSLQNTNILPYCTMDEKWLGRNKALFLSIVLGLQEVITQRGIHFPKVPINLGSNYRNESPIHFYSPGECLASSPDINWIGRRREKQGRKSGVIGCPKCLSSPSFSPLPLFLKIHMSYM